MLTLRYHGGQCCGVMHIHGFSAPTGMQSALNTSPPSFPANGPGGTGCMNMRAPAETTVERLDRYLDWRDGQLEYNITEAVLTDGQLPQWKDILESRGFEIVARCYNSNSYNVINVFLRVKHDSAMSQRKFKEIREKLRAERKAKEDANKKVDEARSTAAKKGWETRRANQPPEEVVVPIPTIPASSQVKCNSCEYGVEPSRVAKGYKRCANCRRKAVNSKKEK